MEENQLFIKIGAPKEFRKTLLTSIRELIHSLQRHETVSQIRKEKAEQVIKLKKSTKEIEVLLNRIKADMPSPKPYKKEKPAPKKSTKGKPKSKKKPEMSEMQKLESQLRDIEGKLKDM